MCVIYQMGVCEEKKNLKCPNMFQFRNENTSISIFLNLTILKIDIFSYEF